ncbi:MAG: FlgD immunoglobulin-like domain containing protein [bacterium]
MSVSKTTNSGATWTRYSVAASGYTYGLAVDPIDPNIVYAGGDPGLYKTTNSGGSWSAATSGISGFIYDIDINPVLTSTIYAATPNGVFKSTNSGISWVNTGCSGVSSVLVDPDNPDIVYAGTISGVYKSTSGGGSWLVMNDSLLDNNVTSLGVDPADYLYCGTQDAGMFRWAFDVGISAGTKSDLGLEPFVYPNPARALVCINYYLVDHSSVELHIYDISGREIKRLVNGQQVSGQHEIWWHGRDNDGCRVPAGIYFYRLSTFTKNVVGKIILQR